MNKPSSFAQGSSMGVTRRRKEIDHTAEEQGFIDEQARAEDYRDRVSEDWRLETGIAMAEPRTSDRESDLRDIAEAYAEVELGRSEARSKPVAYLVVGQDTAGKSALVSDIAERLDTKGGYVAIEAGTLQSTLPVMSFRASAEHWSDGRDVDAIDIGPMSRMDTDRLAEDVLNEAMKGRRNVIVEGVLNTPEQSLQLATQLQNAGYRVELHAQAVNEQISLERATWLYEADKSEGQQATVVNPPAHSVAFREAANTVRRLEFAGAVDQVTVYNRLNDVVFDHAPQPGRTPGAEAFERARSQLTDYERINLAEKWDEIATSMERRGASRPESDVVVDHMARAHYSLRTSPAAAANYDHNHPEMREASRELADRYGAKLENAFRLDRREMAEHYPELKDAFTAQAAAQRYGREQPGISEARFNEAMQERIAQGLRSGQQLQGVQVREAAVRDQATELAR